MAIVCLPADSRRGVADLFVEPGDRSVLSISLRNPSELRMGVGKAWTTVAGGTKRSSDCVQAKGGAARLF